MKRVVVVVRYLIAAAVLSACFSLARVTHAQEPSKENGRVGLYFLGSLNAHSANFQSLPGVPSCCPRFEKGFGVAPAFGMLYDYPLGANTYLGLRAGYSDLSAVLKAQEATTVLLQGVGTAAVFEHEVRAAIPSLILTPTFTVSLSAMSDHASVTDPARMKWAVENGQSLLSHLDFSGGPTVGFILSNTYSQKETLLEPSSQGTFENGQRVRNVLSGSTPNAARLYMGLSVAASYHLPLSSSGALEFVPELQATYGLTRLVTGLEWKANAIAAGASIQYRLFSVPIAARPIAQASIPPATTPAPAIPVPIVPKKPMLQARLDVSMIDTSATRNFESPQRPHADQVEQPVKELLIEDYIRTQYRPLLNYLFFDEGSAQLSGRYHRLSSAETAVFSPERLSELETLPLYYEVLNILGKRMQEYPKSKITIVGCNADVGVEKNDLALSRRRADTVFRYLRDSWHIDSARMRIDVRNLPAQPSTVSDSDGIQEDRRVEIYSNMWQVLEPVFTTDTAHIPKPAIVRFRPEGSSEAGLTHWELSVIGRHKLKDYSGRMEGTPAPLPTHLSEPLDWDLEKEHERTLDALDTVQASLTVTDVNGQEAESPPVVLPVRHYTLAEKHREGSIDTIISRYSLILFDFDRGELSDANQRIAQFVKDRISDKARVKIYGYTDRMGTDEYNKQLSEMRARSTERYIGLESKSEPAAAGRTEVRGLGRSVLLHDNSLPEGRFYSRTVTVIVSTPTSQ